MTITNYRNIFLALLASVLIAIPTAAVLQSKNDQIKKSDQKNMLEIKKRDSELQKMQDLIKSKDDQLKQKTDSEIELKKQNDQLQKDLQAKAERKAEEARIAAANANKQAAVSVGAAGNCESYRPIVAKYFPAGQVNNALLTMSKESSCNPLAVSPTHDHGLMQINEVHLDMVGGNLNALYDPDTNIRVAASIYSGRGWNAWYAVRGILW